MNKIVYIISTYLLSMVLLTGCTNDDVDPVGSTANYPTPSFTLRPGPTTFNESNDAVVTYDIVTDRIIDKNLIFNFKQVGGNAELGLDYETTTGVVRALTTTGEMSVTILNDDLVEGTEKIVLEIESGPDAASAYLVNPNTEYPSPLTIDIENYVGFDLNIGMEWDANNGSESSPTELADLILLVTDAVTPYTETIESSDGGEFEEVTLDSDTPNGDYFIVADVYALDDSDFDVDIDLSFTQPGVINDELKFSAALNSRIICSDYVILAKVTKSGNNWSIATENATLANDGTPDTSAAAPWIGTATILQDDWADYDPGNTIEIEAGANDNEFWIRSYANPYIDNPDTSYMIVTLDPCGSASVVSNEDFEYGCSEGDVTGAGFVDTSTNTIYLSLNFGLGDCGDYAGNAFVLQL